MLASFPLSAEAVQSLVDVVQEEAAILASSNRSSGGKLPRNHSTSSLCSVSSTSSRKGVLAKKVALRKGKWTEEEELYTKKLIDSFNDGLLLKIPHGTTLRTLLSEKLWCDPMRITKKFTGASCIGRQVFSPCEQNESNATRSLQVMDDLERLEDRFIAAIEPRLPSIPGLNLVALSFTISNPLHALGLAAAAAGSELKATATMISGNNNQNQSPSAPVGLDLSGKAASSGSGSGSVSAPQPEQYVYTSRAQEQQHKLQQYEKLQALHYQQLQLADNQQYKLQILERQQHEQQQQQQQPSEFVPGSVTVHGQSSASQSPTSMAAGHKSPVGVGMGLGLGLGLGQGFGKSMGRSVSAASLSSLAWAGKPQPPTTKTQAAKSQLNPKAAQTSTKAAASHNKTKAKTAAAAAKTTNTMPSHSRFSSDFYVDHTFSTYPSMGLTIGTGAGGGHQAKTDLARALGLGLHNAGFTDTGNGNGNGSGSGSGSFEYSHNQRARDPFTSYGGGGGGGGGGSGGSNPVADSRDKTVATSGVDRAAKLYGFQRTVSMTIQGQGQEQRTDYGVVGGHAGPGLGPGPVWSRSSRVDGQSRTASQYHQGIDANASKEPGPDLLDASNLLLNFFSKAKDSTSSRTGSNNSNSDGSIKADNYVCESSSSSVSSRSSPTEGLESEQMQLQGQGQTQGQAQSHHTQAQACGSAVTSSSSSSSSAPSSSPSGSNSTPRSDSLPSDDSGAIPPKHKGNNSNSNSLPSRKVSATGSELGQWEMEQQDKKRLRC